MSGTPDGGLNTNGMLVLVAPQGQAIRGIHTTVHC